MNSPLARYAAKGGPRGLAAFTKIGRGVTAATGGAGARIIVTCAANFPEIGRPPPRGGQRGDGDSLPSPRELHEKSGD